MSAGQLKANTHRFRVRHDSHASVASCRRRSASPDRLALTDASSRAADDRNHPGDEGTAPNTLAGARRSVPSCDRCRTFKKKCSRTFPTCSLCATAGQKCSLSTHVSSVTAQTHHLQARIEWLSGLVNRGLSLPTGKSIETFDTGIALDSLSNPPLRTDAQYQPQGLSPSAVDLVANGGSISTTTDTVLENGQFLATAGQEALNTTEQPRPQRVLSETSTHRQSLAVILASESPSSDLTTTPYPYADAAKLPGTNDAAGSPSVTPGLTPSTFARQCVDAYFRHVNRAYPSIDMTKMYLDVQVIDSWEAMRMPKTPDLTLLHLVMAIGCTTLQRAGKLPKGSSSVFEVGYPNIVQECIRRDDKESLQTLVLVALYSLFDPKGMCAWTIAGIASRQAILRGLSRKSSENESLSTSEIENRRRLFWSIWVLDRMMAFSLGLPAALNDDCHDVPLPGLTVEEFGSMERQYYAAMLQTNRHIIQLRHLEDLILRQVLLRKASDVATMSHADCRSLIQTIRAEIENWYSNGCLVSPLEADSVPLHSSISWLSTRYYNLLLFLHYPCPLNSKGSGLSPRELLPLIQKCLQLTSVLLQQKQLPLNRVTLSRIFPLGLLLLHCIAQTDATQITFSQDSIGIIVNVLEAFPPEWTKARQAATIFRQSLEAISLAGVTRERFYPGTLPRMSGLHNNPYSSSPGVTNESDVPLLQSAIASLTSLMKEILGSASCFIFYELPVAGPLFQPVPSGNLSMAPFATSTTVLPMPTANGAMSQGSPEESIWQIMDPAFF